ncbi:MAG TPA: threonine ammonia-lyase [Firmicutes bacterium]|nr:threonine ammonia-lyase [Bacillota bacterium]
MAMIDKIKDAKRVLDEVVRETALIPAPAINPDAEIYLKCENLQLTGSFKVRGAYYRIANLTEEEKSHGVIACSAGNHAQGVALAAQKFGIGATICIPSVAPLSKIMATKSYGANVVLCDGVYDDAYAKAVEIQKNEGRTFIHPFNDEDVIAGQGTIGLEILKQLPDADAVIVPIGGGGLISGIACAVKAINPNCKVYGVQAAGAPSMKESLDAGKIITLDSVNTIADGIAVKTPGTRTFDICSQYVDEVVTVTEDEIAVAILTLIEKQKTVSEGAGATTVAAAMFNKVDIKGKKVVCVVSGGNIDVNILSRVINKGLVKSGRLLELSTEIADKPGQLNSLLGLIASTGANILSINHNRYNLDLSVNMCEVHLVLETKSPEHVQSIYELLEANGYGHH